MTKTTNNLVITARQILNGTVAPNDRKYLWNTAPLQMICKDEKDEEWKKWNMDWFEHIGIQQLNRETKQIQKYYDLANGVLNIHDYMDVTNESNPHLSLLMEEQKGPFSLKFFPIIPNIINTFVGEFAKRENKILVKAVDEFSKKEALEYKQQMVNQILEQDAVNKILQQFQEAGIDPESEEGIKQIDTAKELATAESKFKSYRGIAEIWAQHTLERDYERYKLYELELEGFRDSLVADREFWEIEIEEDKYRVNLWNPLNTFYHKSPDVAYTSQGNYIGNIKLMSIPDVLNVYGHKIKKDQYEQLIAAQNRLLARGNTPLEDAYKHDSTNYWDITKPYGNQQPNSIHYEHLVGIRNMAADLKGGYSLDRTLNTFGNGYSIWNNHALLRVTKVYWMSQKKVGELTWIKEDGTLLKEIVDENYEVTVQPVYDQSIIKKECVDNLLYGEHIDWIWVNEVWRGIKIGPNAMTYYQSSYTGFDPIYIDVEPLPFQFKGSQSLYGAKLPVEGRIFSDRNSTSQPLCSKIESYQMCFNVVNNQIVDMLADEIGKVFIVDQNMIPRNSMGGSWGKHNFGKFHQVMKDFSVAPVDTSMQNTENPGTNFNHFQAVDLSKTDRLMGRMELARYFKEQAFEIVGISPQRAGSVMASESATGVQQAVNNSYAQTEIYFEQHMNFLMPRVRQMMLEAAQFVTANKIKKEGVESLAYINSKEESIWFQIEEDKMLLRDFDIYPMSRANIKELMRNLKQIAMENNTAGGSLYDIASTLSSNSPAEIITKLKEAEDKKSQQISAQQQHEQKMQAEQQDFLERQRTAELQNENYWKERQIQTDIYIAQIKAMGYPNQDDMDNNQIPDVLEVNKFLHQQGIDATDQLMKQEELNHKKQIDQKTVELKDKEIEAKKYIADKQLAIAKENKTKSELKSKKKK